MRISKLNEQLTKLLEGTKLYEFALDRAKVKSDLNAQMIPLFQHIAKLQLFGYNSDIIKTIYDIYDKLNDINDSKKGRSFMSEKNIKDWLLNFVEDEEDYLNAVYRLFNKLSNKYAVVSNNISYDNYNKVQNYILSLLSTGEIVHREEFEDVILNKLGVEK